MDDVGIWVAVVIVCARADVVLYPVVEICDVFAVAEVAVSGVVLSVSFGGVVDTSVFCGTVSFLTVVFVFVCNVNCVGFTVLIVVNSFVVIGVVVCIFEHGM